MEFSFNPPVLRRKTWRGGAKAGAFAPCPRPRESRLAIRLTEQISSIGRFAVTESQGTEDEHDDEDDSKISEFWLKLESLAGLQHVDLCAFPLRQSGELLRVANQLWNRAIVNRNHALRRQELHSLRRVFWSHGEMFSNRQQGQVYRRIFPDQPHIGEKSSVAGVINCFSFRLEHNSCRLAKVQRSTPILDHRRAVESDREPDPAKGELTPTSMIHRHSLGSLRFQPIC